MNREQRRLNKKGNKNITGDYGKDIIIEKVYNILIEEKNEYPKYAMGMARELTDKIIVAVKNGTLSIMDVRKFIDKEYKLLKSCEAIDNKREIIKRLKEKKIEELSTEELQYIIENDDTIVSNERIVFVAELFRRSCSL